MNILQEFFEGDASSSDLRNHYLSMARNVLSGNHKSLEVAGDAFYIKISTEGVAIESLWDDEANPVTIGLEQFIELLSQ